MIKRLPVLISIVLIVAIGVIVARYALSEMSSDSTSTPSLERPTKTAINERSRAQEQTSDPLPPSSQTNKTVVVLPNQAVVDQFLIKNDLSSQDITPTDLANTFLVARSQDNLKLEGVDAFPELKYRAQITPNDALYNQQWHLPRVSAPTAWDTTTGSGSTVIAVIDTGFALTHQDLAPKFTSPTTWRDFVCDDNIPQAGDADCDSNPTQSSASHGTLTAGAAASASNNALGVASPDWSAKVLPLQGLEDDGSGTTTNIAAAVEYATSQDVDVISLSLGTTGIDTLLRQKIDAALGAGISVVAAIGNCGNPATYVANGCDFVGQQLEPATYTPVMGVGASDQNDNRANFSSYGSGVDLLAPGVGILTTDWSNSNQTTKYAAASGTSLATPIVAGTLGLLRAAHGSLTPSEVTNVVTTSIDKVGQMNGANRTNEHGYGRLNAQKVITLSGLTCPLGVASANNIAGAPTGEKILGNRFGGAENLSIIMHNNTGSGCIEVHTLVGNLQQFIQHKATNRDSINPLYAEVIAADTKGDGVDELMTVEYQQTGSGFIEVHRWSSSYQHWAAHIATNRPVINPTDADVISADRDGDGRDELFLVEYQNTGSGRVEVHGWTPNLQQWSLHAATTHPAVNPADNSVIAADVNGDGKDEFLLVKYRNNGSNAIELHGWTSDFQNWFLHTTVSHSWLDPADNEVIGANIISSGPDEMLLVKYRGTGSGKMEVHGWTPSFQNWFLHAALP